MVGSQHADNFPYCTVASTLVDILDEWTDFFVDMTNLSRITDMSCMCKSVSE